MSKSFSAVRHYTFFLLIEVLSSLLSLHYTHSTRSNFQARNNIRFTERTLVAAATVEVHRDNRIHSMIFSLTHNMHADVFNSTLDGWIKSIRCFLPVTQCPYPLCYLSHNYAYLYHSFPHLSHSIFHSPPRLCVCALERMEKCDWKQKVFPQNLCVTFIFHFLFKRRITFSRLIRNSQYGTSYE